MHPHDPTPSQPTHSPSFQGWPHAFDDLRREHGFQALRLHGTLPSDLAGTLYFNGPGSFSAFGERSPFWLDGDGALSAVRIAAGSAQAAVRMVRTRSYRAEQRAGRRLYSRFERRSPRPLQEYLDALGFADEPIAKLHLDQHVPPPFHGTFADTRRPAPHPGL
jgi:all-trans-8'-apo-beta-carotenal 15,15'-oxygenase